MIIMASKSAGPEGFNVIHCMLGPETELWCDVHGAAIADIAPFLRTMDLRKPVVVNVTRCRNEREVVDALKAAGLMPSDAGDAVDAPQPVFPVQQSEPSNIAPAVVGNTETPPVGNCTRCKNPNSRLVPGLKPDICYQCVNIDLYIAAKRRQANGPVPLVAPAVIARDTAKPKRKRKAN